MGKEFEKELVYIYIYIYNWSKNKIKLYTAKIVILVSCVQYDLIFMLWNNHHSKSI